MDSNTSELIAVLALYAAAGIPALIVYMKRRDPFDPRVFFPVFYAYVTSGVCLFSFFWSGQYHPGLKTGMLIPVLLSCSTAILGFSTGCTFALHGKISHIPGRRIVHSVSTTTQLISNRLVRNVSCLASLIAISIYACLSHYMQIQQAASGGIGKVDKLAFADETTLRWFYLFAAVSTATLTLAVITDAFVSRKIFSPTIVALLLADFLVCTYSGERDFLLVGGIWCIANWPKLSRIQLILFLIAIVGWFGISSVLRTSGLGFGSQINAINDVRLEDWFYSLTHFAPNVHVFTNVATEVPAVDEHWYGYSLLGAFASFIPGNFPLKDITPANWFQDVYDMQGASGFAFSQDAEAYLNFGWLGPPIWFAVWGYFLAVLYRKAIQPRAHLWNVFIWWFAVSVSLFGIRSDSRGIIKMFILGAIASKILCVLADAWAARTVRELPQRRVHPPARPVPRTTS